MIKSRLDQRVTRLEQLLHELSSSLTTRLDRLEQDQAATHHGVVALQTEVERLREQLLPAQAERLDRAEQALRDQQQHTERRLDGVQTQLTKAHERLQRKLAQTGQRAVAAAGRLAAGHSELTSLVDRLLLQQPLPAPAADVGPEQGQLTAVQPLLVESFRGSEAEIRERLRPHLELLCQHGPVLDLGAGRGELLQLLGEAGTEAFGIEGDPALVAAARRRGLQVIEGEVLAVLRDQPAAHWGAVTAFHLLEHLPPAALLQVLAEIRRVLGDGGLLLVESPNPHSLRVGASLYWLDPTHQHPLLPETLVVMLRASGLEPELVEQVHPFPPDQQLLQPQPGATDAVLEGRLDRLCQRLDELLNGPRDFLILARKPTAQVPGCPTRC